MTAYEMEELQAMTTSSKTETDSGRQCENPDWIDKTVSDAFGEFLAALSVPRKLHKSEHYNIRSCTVRKHGSASKLYDIITPYHSYCRLCEQHFYTRSVAGDVNSFFQKHANTSYHRQLRTVVVPPDEEPIFTWEETYFTGRCNICGISGLNAYFLDSGCSPAEIMKQHACVWDRDNRASNSKMLLKLNLLRRYCELKIFREKFIKTVQGNAVCLLCGLKLPWPQEKVACHLGSDVHYQKFCLFLRKCFDFSPKDVLNGFNLEMVTRALVSRDPPPILNFSVVDEEQKCLEESNSLENPYPEKRNFSFSPVEERKETRNEETDFVHEDSCLLCNVAVEPGHLSSKMHFEKAKNLSQGSFDSPAKYATYCRNMSKRLHAARSLKRLELWQKNPIEEVQNPPKKKKPQVPRPSPSGRFFRTVLREKLDLVNAVFTVTNSEIYCQVCDEHVASSKEMLHLSSPKHKSQEGRWQELKRCFKDNKFVETFEKLRTVILCLVCGAVITFGKFHEHLKSEMHRHRFEWYSGLDVSVPISSGFAFRKDFSCLCTICMSPMNKTNSWSSLKTTLKNVMYHWPCPRLKDAKDPRENGQGPGTVILDGKVEENDGDSGREASEPENGTRSGEDGPPGVDFEKVERTLESIVSLFEERVMENVMEQSARVIGQSEDRKAEERRTVERETPPPRDCDHSTTGSSAGEPTENSPRREKWGSRKSEDDLTNGEESPEGEGEADEEGKEEDEEEEKEEKEAVEKGEGEHEVIVIEGLSKSKKKASFIYSKFGRFGKIGYVCFEKTLAILAFVTPGVAEEAIKGSENFVQSQKVKLTISKSNILLEKKLAEEKPACLDDSVRLLLANPQALMDFVLNLMMQAVEASESSVERKREELVCSTIISAVFEAFPQGRCYPFGSRLSGLTLNNSDLDVFLDCGGMYEGFKNSSLIRERQLVDKVGNLLRKKEEVTKVIVVARARVPIVSFLHKPTLMHCDLSFKNGLSIHNTLLIKFMTSLDWRVRPLILFLKHWAKLNGLHGPPNFSSYALAMLVIYYLEQLESPVLPTIESLQKSYVGRRTTIGGWDCSINTNPLNIKKSENKEPFPELLAGLFAFYAGFDYKSNVISPLTGKLLARSAFSTSDSTGLPMCYKRHALNIPPPIESLVDSKIPICIIDPFDVSHVLTKSFTSRNLQNFTQLCRQSQEHLRKGIDVVTSDS